MKHIVKWGIIGLGNIAFKFANAFYNADNAELIAVASKSNEKLIKFKQNFNLRNENLYNNYEKILDNDQIDIYYIALPNSLHFEWVSKLVEKKKNILVEKPAFMSTKDAENIFSNNNFENIFLGEGYMYRYHPQIYEITNMIGAGEIGKLIRMESNFGINLIYKKNFFGFKTNKKIGGGVILDQGCYTTSMSLLIASLINNLNLNNSKIEDVKTNFLETNIDVNSRAKINFDNKFKSYISTSFTENLGNRTLIIGDAGKIVLENSWNSEECILELSGKINKKKVFNNIKNIYTLEIENVSKDIIEGKKEASFPGANKKEIFHNTKLINSWINE